MKIGIEAQRIFRKEKHGMDLVAVHLIRHLQAIDRENEYIVFVQDDEDNTVIKETSNFKIVKTRQAPYPYWEQVLLPKYAREHAIDILHCTSNTAPLSVHVPLVLTLHDIIYLEKLNLSKGSWYQILGNLYRRWNVPRVVKQAARLITVSDFEKKRICNHFGLNNERVETIYNGVSDYFQRVDDPVILNTIKKKYNLPNNYVFFLGNTDPKKNMKGVLRALSILRRQGKLNFQLLMLDIDRTFLIQMATAIGDPAILKHISFTGYIPNHELPAIYSMAKIFLYPSLRESFGIPILEAMACGTPVITSNTSSMPEVAGDAAVLADPFNPNDLAQKILLVLENDSLRNQLVEKGTGRFSRFTWASSARKTLGLYQSLATATQRITEKQKPVVIERQIKPVGSSH